MRYFRVMSFVKCILKLENEEITPVEYFTVHLAPVDNQRPVLRVEPALMHVPEGHFIELNTLEISLKDEDTNIDMIKICVKEQPSNGLIENISPAVGGEQSRQGQEIQCFSFDEVEQGFIRYNQFYHLDHEPRNDAFILQATDGKQKSGEIEIFVHIDPANDEAPELMIEPVTCREGNLCEIGSKIHITDADLPKDRLTLNFSSPKNGLIVNQVRAETVMNARKCDKCSRFLALRFCNYESNYRLEQKKRAKLTEFKNVKFWSSLH